VSDDPENAQPTEVKADAQTRLLLPVLRLGLSKPWDVGTVRFHPAGAASEMIASQGDSENGFGPTWYQELVKAKAGELDNWAVADVTVSGVQEAIPLVERAVAVLRTVQHIDNPMVSTRLQTFGLPGQVGSARIDYLSLSPGPAWGWQHWGALAGWSFGDQSYNRWMTDPAYRFINAALSRTDANRTPLQRRALIAIDLLSQAWLSWQPDVSLLNHVMAIEALLGEPHDQNKKVRIARRASYFVCGWPRERYPDGRRPACPYLSLPINDRGQPQAELDRIIQGGRQAAFDAGIYCSMFFDLLDLYNDRNEIMHRGKLELTPEEEGPATWFIASWLLQPVLTWFAEHPDAELSELDAEIGLLPPRQPEPAAS
jgi:hypothetical protein